SALLRKRKIDCEHRTLPESFALCADPPAVQLDQVPHHRQAQTKSALLSRDRTFSLTKPIEHVRQKICCDSLTSIADTQPRRRLHTMQIYLHAASALRELDRVRQQVPNYLPQAIGITLHQAFFGE